MSERGTSSGYDGQRRCNGSKVHVVANDFGHLLALRVSAAEIQDRAPVRELTLGSLNLALRSDRSGLPLARHPVHSRIGRKTSR